MLGPSKNGLKRVGQQISHPNLTGRRVARKISREISYEELFIKIIKDHSHLLGYLI